MTSLRRRWQPGERLVVAVAAPVGRARLIDNALVEVPVASERPAQRHRPGSRRGDHD